MFFGTPHGGGNRAPVGDVAFSIARFLYGGKEKNSFMEALEGKSFFAELNRDDFLERARDFSFVSFYETNKLHGVHQVRYLRSNHKLC